MIQHIYNMLRSEDGAAAIEYALIVALIAGAIVAGFVGFEEELTALFNDVGDSVDQVTGDQGG